MNLQRFTETIEALNMYGRSYQGMNRLAYTEIEQEALAYLITLFEHENMTVTVDAAGNVIARREGMNPELPAVACGSHIDSVYNGGKYDGTVGVLAGLEVVRMLNEENIETKHPIEIIVFACEESARFGVATIGSKAMTGKINKEMLKTLKDKDNITIREAFQACDLDVNQIENARRSKKAFKAFYELHIEQGPVLETSGYQVGLVTGIAAPTRFIITVKGQAAHSGSTPMHLRADAFCAAAEITLALERLACLEKEHGTVATVGSCHVAPGAMNVIPGNVELSVDIRSTSVASKEKVVKELNRLVKALEARRKLTIDVKKLGNESPVMLDDSVIGMMEETCEQMGISYLKMASGAGHDVMNMASLCPSGLIFVPSKNGLSHHPEEFTSIEEINSGVLLLKEVMVKAALGGVSNERL
ncbi:Zn-dependent hydrolase [Virgibacillus sp. W0430]|uniref:Zn-dependent hydrolase n=1 Tax=Virgibacillus sp. W0430 TaxID=3391580 RepID=UPI003F45CB4D